MNFQQISESSDGNTNEHIYNYQYDTLPDKIYIKAPDIYVFEQGRSNSSLTHAALEVWLTMLMNLGSLSLQSL